MNFRVEFSIGFLEVRSAPIGKSEEQRRLSFYSTENAIEYPIITKLYRSGDSVVCGIAPHDCVTPTIKRPRRRLLPTASSRGQ
jgi:hypothetical protein